MYTQAGGNIQGVLAANDGLANSVIQILERNNAAGANNVTGQDATAEGLQNILAGDQCMTVYKSIREEANALADARGRADQRRGGPRPRAPSRTPRPAARSPRSC